MTPAQRFMAAAALVSAVGAVFFFVRRPEGQESWKAWSVRESLTAQGEAAKVRAIYAKLLPDKQETLALIDKVKDPHYWIVVASSVAMIHETLDAWKEAEQLHTEILLLSEQAYGARARETADALKGLALFLTDTNRPMEAEPLMRRALVIDEACYSADDPVTARDLGQLVMVLKKMNRLDEAEPLLRRALAIDEKCYGKMSREVGHDLRDLTFLLIHTNRGAEAEPFQSRWLEIFISRILARDVREGELRNLIGEFRIVRMEMGDTEPEAWEKLEQMLKQAGKEFPPRPSAWLFEGRGGTPTA